MSEPTTDTLPDAPPPTDAPPDGGKSFSQADVDRIVSERLARAKSSPPPDYDQLKAAASELEQLKAAQLSETEKLQKRAEAAEAKAAEAASRAQGALRRAAIVAAAQRAGAVDPDAVVALLDQSSVTVDDDGTVTGAEEAVKDLLKAKQYLVGKTPTPAPGGADGGPRGKAPTSITKESLKAMTPQQIAALPQAEIDRVLAGN